MVFVTVFITKIKFIADILDQKSNDFNTETFCYSPT